jgi:ElaB/YqjD/DUF883 family membrane-anchored ribosome-binding protein
MGFATSTGDSFASLVNPLLSIGHSRPVRETYRKVTPMASIGSFDNDLSSTVSNTASNLGDKARDAIDTAGSKVSSYASKAQAGVMDAKDRATRAADDLSRTSRQAVKDHPLAAVAIGVGIGFILGRVLFR